MSNDTFNTTIIEEFKFLAQQAMRDAQYAHDLIFENNEKAAIAYLNSAISKFSALKSLYYARYELLAHPEFDTLLHCFDSFEREMLNNIRTNHSHQWTDIEFAKFKDSFESSGISQ